MLERETAAANMQAEVVRSEQQVKIQENVAGAARVQASADADITRMRAGAEAEATRINGDAIADAARAKGAATAASYQAGIGALGEQAYTAVQLASILAGTKLVPDVVLGEGRGNLADVLLARMATSAPVPTLPAVTNGVKSS